MKNIELLKRSLFMSLLVSLAFAIPAMASTEDEVKALKAEIEGLHQGQQQIQKDLAEIKKLLEQGARAAPAGGSPFTPKDLVVGTSAFIGSADAPVTMFSYSDFQCPYCRRHATTVMQDLIKEYVDSGKLRIVLREFPIPSLHPRAYAASQAAVCAGLQGRYQEMHDLIFANQNAMTDDDFNGFAQTLGVDQAAFETCYADEEITEGIRADISEGQSMGVSGTPSFVVGLTDPGDANKVRVTQYIRGAVAFPSFQGVIDDLLKEAAE